MRFRIGLSVVMVVALTGCWAQPGGDSGGSFSSPWPTPISPLTVSTLRQTFTATAGADTAQPDLAVANGTLFIAGDHLIALDAAGTTNCSGAPRVCTPLWTSSETDVRLLGPVVDGGKVWVTTGAGRLRGYDANGVTSCSGIPKRCTAVIDVAVSDYAGVPVAAAEGVFVLGSKFVGGGFTDSVMAFDRNGQLRWSAPLGSGPEPEYLSPVVSNGTVFAVSQGRSGLRVVAFDGNGIRGCSSGTPAACSALWSTNPVSFGIFQIAVRDGQLYRADGSSVAVFDANGVAGCSAGTCLPTWSTSSVLGDKFAVTATTLVVAAGDSAYGFAVQPSGCSGVPTVCQPVWKGAYPAGHRASQLTPTAAGGVAYLSLNDGIATYAVDGLTGCSGGAPRNCSVLSFLPSVYQSRAPIVVGGFAYVVRLIRVKPSGPVLDVTAYSLP